tara:strand:+ start:17840 stop:18898 length:1059 start_codon:yes stop_codon:yes gene_type:complete
MNKHGLTVIDDILVRSAYSLVILILLGLTFISSHFSKNISYYNALISGVGAVYVYMWMLYLNQGKDQGYVLYFIGFGQTIFLSNLFCDKFKLFKYQVLMILIGAFVLISYSNPLNHGFANDSTFMGLLTILSFGYIVQYMIHEKNKKIVSLVDSQVDNERNQQVTAMASGLSHSINNTLMRFNSLLELKGVQGEDIEDFNLIREEFNKVNEILNKFFPKSSDKEFCNLPAIIKSIVPKSIKDDVNLKLSDSNVLINKKAFIEIIKILFKNSLDFNKKDIYVSSYIEDNTLFLEYSDSGLSDLEDHNIFTAFYTTKENPNDGIGLGLYYLKNIVKQNKGTVILDKGIRISFPL